MPKSYLAIFLLVFLGCVYLYLLLPGQVGVGADTVIYYGAAQNLLDGRNLTLPFGSTFAGHKDELMTHFPPLYSVVLAAVAYFVGGVAQAAWLLTIFLWGGLLLTVGLLMWFYCPQPAWIAVLAVFLMMSAAGIIRLYTVALSEPIFILCWLGGFFFLDRYLQQKGWGLFLLSALLLSLTLLTRFSGIAFIGAGSVWLLRRQGWRTAVVYGLLTVLPLTIWLSVASQVGSPTNRDVSIHWISAHHFWQGVYAISAWLAPDNLPTLLRLGVWIVLLGSLVWLIWRRQFAQTKLTRLVPHFFIMLLLSTGIYLAVIVFSISFLDVQVRLSPRIMSPVYLALLLPALYALSEWWPQATETARRIVGISGILLCLAYLVSMVYTFKEIHQNGEHYTNSSWRSSETLQFLQTSPSQEPIVSNLPDLIYFYTGNPATAIPAQFHNTSLRPNATYENEMALLAQEMAAGSQLVYFHDTNWRWFLPSEDSVVASLSLRPLRQFPNATIYILDENLK
ncbi:MAG: hypothetical protein GY796_00205 [Chloroflexi bacterium]|nr:hypothetical protein [Chloroflexota bacterium]